MTLDCVSLPTLICVVNRAEKTRRSMPISRSAQSLCLRPRLPHPSSSDNDDDVSCHGPRPRSLSPASFRSIKHNRIVYIRCQSSFSSTCDLSAKTKCPTTYSPVHMGWRALNVTALSVSLQFSGKLSA